ncbi:MAG: imidazole glycerol phosphate synthase subunit HisH [Candidatus Omnitrophota bacterium]|nr:imidazole glycerol phosphate synthase subunit HisH [Candidatus Omnitrophota bacterium]
MQVKSQKYIAVIDYGMGNLRSVQKALEVVGAETKVTSNPKDLARCEKLVLPGVGAFGEAMRELKRLKLVEPIKDAIADGKPFLGLCLGLQLLFERSEEAPGVKGLCVLEGEVKRFKFRVQGSGGRVQLKVPHMGWNNISGFRGQGPGFRILKGVPENSYMYFVHSYYVKPKGKDVILTTTDYGIDFVSGICKDNIYGFQFHPEKSQGLGLKVLENFVNL